MGMAASQARHLALVARQSNCEYEGQQINQARLALSNQSANLFNQMLTLSVPVPPSTQDFTKTQYSFTDGYNDATIDSWQQLATPEEDYNYVVSYHYYSDVYTGAQKKLNDPQVQFTGVIPSSTGNYSAEVAEIQAKLMAITQAEKDYEEANNAYLATLSEASKLQTFNDLHEGIQNVSHDVVNETYTVTPSTGTTGTSSEFVSYTKSPDANILAAVKQLAEWGAIDDSTTDPDMSDVYYCAETGQIAFGSDLASCKTTDTNRTGTKTTLPIYNIEESQKSDPESKSINTMQAEITAAKAEAEAKKALLEVAEKNYEKLSVPDYVGNCELTPISEMTDNQMAEILQIMTDMEDQDVKTNFTKCFNTYNEDYSKDNYQGGIYSFKLNGVTYFTTYYDLATTANSGEGINNIDQQDKLAYYNASYVSTKIEKTDKALLETDSNGRFTSVKLGDDTVTYTLNMETVTDDVAYQDAMNKYYYENAVYDKTIQDINAKTSIIQQQDQQLELRLKQLDTERNALTNEIEAVSKVVSENVESSFKTFGG